MVFFYLLISESDMDFYETPNSNGKNKVKNNIEKNLLQTPLTTQKHKKNECFKKLHQSLTFIGELASTSTPTQNSAEPITSTPNASTHNAFKYHPSKTIRNKKLKRKLFTTDKENISCINEIESILKQHKNLLKIEFETKAKQRNAYKNHHHHHHNNCPCFINKFNQFYELKRLAHSSPKVSASEKARLRLKKASSIEKRLKDLLYTPNKLKQIMRKQQQHEELKKLQNYYRYKSELTTPSNTPAKAGALATSSKIYYL